MYLGRFRGINKVEKCVEGIHNLKMVATLEISLLRKAACLFLIFCREVSIERKAIRTEVHSIL